MPSDKYLDEIYDYVYAEQCKQKRELEQSYINKLNNMTLEEKVDYLIKEHIYEKVYRK